MSVSAGYQTIVALKEIRVDQRAKETLDHDIDPLTRVHYADLKPLVNSYTQQVIHLKWDVFVHDRDLISWNQH